MPERRHAVVTGAGGDIGAAIAAELVRRGHRVTALDRKPVDEIMERFTDPGVGSHVTAVSVDLRDRSELADAIAAMDSIDAAVGNAGVGTSSPFLDTSDELWDDTLAVNLTANFVFGQLVARRMVADAAGGRIVFTGSWVGDVPWPEITAYSVSKAGLVMLAKQMAKELAPHRILVNVVAPGIVDAGLSRVLRETDPAYKARATRVIPLGDFQTTAQVANVTAFLCSPDADYVTGTVLTADGGCSLFHIDGA